MAIELKDMQSAEPHQCGSCNYFERRNDYDSFGICRFRLPPWVRKKGDAKDDLNEVDPRTIQDTDSCSLYQPKQVGAEPVQFVKKFYWHAGEPSP